MVIGDPYPPVLEFSVNHCLEEMVFDGWELAPHSQEVEKQFKVSAISVYEHRAVVFLFYFSWFFKHFRQPAVGD